MARVLKRRLRRLAGLGVLAALGIFGLRGPAQGADPDPTRPPDTVEARPAEAHGAPVLQSVIIPRSGEPLAIIGGQEVKLGAMVGDSRLVRLSEREAVLEGPQGIVRLPLTPGIEKKGIAQGRARDATRRGQP